jgi:hypothetical protein
LILNYFTKEKPGLIWVVGLTPDGSDFIKMKGILVSNLGRALEIGWLGGFFSDSTG